MIKDNSRYDVVIVGSGFSGIAAAEILADYDLSILLLDENIHLGGQLLRKIPDELGEPHAGKPEKIKRVGFGFVEKVRAKKITLMNKTTLIGAYENNEILVEYDRQRTFSLKYGVLLFATGARERFLPFKGWTLPGVYAPGFCQVLIKSSGVLPAKRILIAGSGLFLFAAANEFLKNGGQLLGLMEQSGFWGKVKFLPQAVHHLSKFTEGGRYIARILASRAPVRFRRQVIEARGDGRLEEVVVAKLDRHGVPIPGSEKVIKTDALAVGYGFVPNIEGPELAGCALEYDANKGGWIVKVNDALETSVDGILAAGEITGVGGAEKSLTEGRIAARTIMNRLGVEDRLKRLTGSGKLRRERKHHLGFVKAFNSLYRIKPQTVLAIPDETIVCRCENVDMRTIKQAIPVAWACHDPNSLKTLARCAMGQCQGRTCGPVIYDLMRTICGRSAEEIGLFTARPPLKPVTIRALKGEP